MREPLRDAARVHHILDACNILVERSKTDSLMNLETDPIKFYGYVKLVEIIGEATYKLTKEYRSAHPEIPWRMMEGMRHVLVHDYYRISPIKLWNTVVHDIPQLIPLIEKILNEQ